MRRGERAGSRRDHEETLYRKAKPVSGFHRLLQQDSRTSACRGRNAAVLPGLPVRRAPNDPDARSSRPDRPNARRGTLHPPADPPRGTARLGLGRAAGVRSAMDVKKLPQPASSRTRQCGEVTGEFVGIENIPDRRLETRRLPREFRVLFGCLGKIHQFLSQKIVEGVLHPKTPLDPPRCPALLHPHLPWTPKLLRRSLNKSAIPTAGSRYMRLV